MPLSAAKTLFRPLVPNMCRRWYHALSRQRRLRPRLGRVRFGQLRRTTPFSRVFGADRGRPIDRYYIERFLQHHAADIKGRVLEVGDRRYTREFGQDRVTQSDVLHVTAGNPNATIVDDLESGERLPTGSFDCVILTQTLQYVFDLRAAFGTLHQILAPGGVLLLTVPGISQDSRGKRETWPEYWRFTSMSTKRLLGECFTAERIDVTAFGNVFASIALLHGLAFEDVKTEELDVTDPKYEMLICARARKNELAR